MKDLKNLKILIKKKICTNLNIKYSIHIPETIWQTGYDNFNELKYPFNLTLQTWKKMNPDWEHIYMSDDDARKAIEKFNNPVLTELSHYLNKCFLADLWRYIMVYQHGGVYVDLDSVAFMPLYTLKYMSTTTKAQLFIPMKVNGFGYKHNMRTILNLEGEKQYCKSCHEFIKEFNLGEDEKSDWLPNNGFAAIPKSIPLKNVLEEVENRFLAFKKLHKNNFDANHITLAYSVDCSAFEVGIMKTPDLLSSTFIHDIQSCKISLDTEDKAFKDFYVDYSVLSIKEMMFSDFEKSL